MVAPVGHSASRGRLVRLRAGGWGVSAKDGCGPPLRHSHLTLPHFSRVVRQCCLQFAGN